MNDPRVIAFGPAGSGVPFTGNSSPSGLSGQIPAQPVGGLGGLGGTDLATLMQNAADLESRVMSAPPPQPGVYTPTGSGQTEYRPPEGMNYTPPAGTIAPGGNQAFDMSAINAMFQQMTDAQKGFFDQQSQMQQQQNGFMQDWAMAAPGWGQATGNPNAAYSTNSDIGSPVYRPGGPKTGETAANGPGGFGGPWRASF